MENIVFFYLLYFQALACRCCFLALFWNLQHCFCLPLYSPWTALFVVVCCDLHCPNCRDQQCVLLYHCWHCAQLDSHLQGLFCLRCWSMPLCFWCSCCFLYAFICYWRHCCPFACCALVVWTTEVWTLLLVFLPWSRQFLSTTSLCCVFVEMCVFCMVIQECLSFGIW